MLEHARTSTGPKQRIALNALTEECLQLAYQGLRTKDPDFVSQFELDFDNSLRLFDGVPQQLSRVFINLFSNAFYALGQQAKQAPPGYQPMLTVRTRQTNTAIEIYVGDNGTGIPDTVKAKVFHPFFTTKPPGQGTGLGLSLSYDIITKIYGGEILVETELGQGTRFTVRLPVGV